MPKPYDLLGKISFMFCKESVKPNRSYGTKFKHWLIIDISTGGR